MPQLLVAALIIGLVWYGLKFFARASPARVARIARYGGGAVSGAVGALLLLRGRFDLGIAGISIGLWLAGFARVPSFLSALRPAAQRADGQSTVRSATIEMVLDHTSGAMHGSIIAGDYAGRPLETLTRSECEGFHRALLRDDPEGARLLEPYMDRRFPGWGEAGHTERDARFDERGFARNRSGLSEQQAYEILGLGKGAGRDDVVRAHRTLMKERHPDHGGTTDDAARLNEAKDVLMRRFDR